MKSQRQIKNEAKRMFRLCFVNGLLDEDRVRQVLQRIIRDQRRGGLVLLSHFQRLVKIEIARRSAEVESTTPLAADFRERIEAGLTRIYGPGLRASFVQNPELIGGMRIKVGSDVYDGSVRARLAELERAF